MSSSGPTHDLEITELEDVLFPSATGGRKRAKGPPPSCEVVRALALDDVEKIANPSTLGSRSPGLKSLRSTHHNLARLVATGRPIEEVSLITGFTANYISVLMTQDQAFGELLEHYKKQKEEVFVDVLERMKLLGLHSLDELQSRLAENPDDWTKGQLLDLAKLMLGSEGALAAGRAEREVKSGVAGLPAISFNVNFVKADHKEKIANRPMLELELEAKDISE